MKFLKVLAVATVAMFAVEGAKAQVVVSAQIGTPPPPVRTVVVERPVARRVVVVNRYHSRPRYRRTVVVARPVYYRPHHRRVVIRHY
ncbi:hypothetical protein [Mucilaginibacter sp. AK015]|uniref:hypothetical protein n=1 Tax=Mucilaginibacter sp. AK015 TaxID=2723072 RepID=UPI00162297C8|nr:hypothetical protein [Mucilaginibacter sp. AK015]MBB5395524.1 hypothetical protein [Mucilaginibacter sp. AK015]